MCYYSNEEPSYSRFLYYYQKMLGLARFSLGVFPLSLPKKSQKQSKKPVFISFIFTKKQNKHFGKAADALVGDGALDVPTTSAAPAEAGKRLVLFTTSTCPKCVMAKKFLADAGISYETVVVDQNPAPAKQYGVRQAPTLLVLDGEQELERVENPSNIRAFCERSK